MCWKLKLQAWVFGSEADFQELVWWHISMTRGRTLDCKIRISINVRGKWKCSVRIQDRLWIVVTWPLDTSPWLKYSPWVAKQWILSKCVEINKIQHGLGTDFSCSGRAPLAPGHGPKSGPESKQNVFYADAWKLEIARRVFGPVADFPELVWWHIAMTRSLTTDWKSMVSISIYAKLKFPMRSRDRL